MVYDDKIMTLHPDGKKGANIDSEKYEIIRTSMVEILGNNGEMSWGELLARMVKRLGGNFQGSVGWYFTTVKLDLQTRGRIEVRKEYGRQMISLPRYFSEDNTMDNVYNDRTNR